MLAFYDQPDAIHVLLDKIQDLYAATIRAGIDAAGGEEYITTTDFEDVWYPEGWKGHVSDDICAGFGPDAYAEFSAPYHARIFAEFGAGGLHNCGPNPCHAAYVAQPLSLRSLDLADTYSHDAISDPRQSIPCLGLAFPPKCKGIFRADPYCSENGLKGARIREPFTVPQVRGVEALP